jgi:hypothetical protein
MQIQVCLDKISTIILSHKSKLIKKFEKNV